MACFDEESEKKEKTKLNKIFLFDIVMSTVGFVGLMRLKKLFSVSTFFQILIIIMSIFLQMQTLPILTESNMVKGH